LAILITKESILVNILCAILMVGSNCFLKMVLVDQSISWKGSFIGFGKEIIHLLSYPMIWFGVLLFIGANFLWLLILATQKLGTAYPLQIGLVFLFSTLTSLFVFGEKFSAVSVAGLLLVVCGIVLITK
jgi:multidrug transporter EmrE-like cation transporter